MTAMEEGRSEREDGKAEEPDVSAVCIGARALSRVATILGKKDEHEFSRPTRSAALGGEWSVVVLVRIQLGIH